MTLVNRPDGRRTRGWIARRVEMPCNKPLGPIDYYCEPRLKSGAWKVTDWKLIVDQYGTLVWATASRLLGNHADAQDCFQETFCEAIKLARREPVRDWGSLLRHLATVRALDLLRVRCRTRSRTDAQADPAAAIGREADPSQEAEALELAERLRAALAQLPPQQANVFCIRSRR